MGSSASSSTSTRVPSAPTPLWSVLVVTFLGSISTGVFWNAISFIAKQAYGFEPTRNLLLYTVMGVIYTVGAFAAGPVSRWSSRWMSPRSLLLICTAAQSLVCVGPIVLDAEWTLWLSGAVVSFALSLVWPIIESYLSAGRHGAQMRSAIAWFNLTWMPAAALPLLLMPPILENHAEWAIGSMAIVNLIMMVFLLRFASKPGHHDADLALAPVPQEYGLLLRCARVLLPLSYVLNAAMMPIVPYRLEAIGAKLEWHTPATATWMIVRVVACAIMWRIGFWHGRWGTLLTAGLAMTGGFALVVLAPSTVLMLSGFAIFGIGMGISYYAALYYALAVGRAEVDAGGTHEALIGAGYAIGPAAGLIGISGAAVINQPEQVVTPGAAIVAVVWSLVGIGAIAALQPYLRARRQRRALA